VVKTIRKRRKVMSNQMEKKKRIPICKHQHLIRYRVTLEMKMEFVEKVKKMSNEALTKMV
jgi:hypothetical protein